MEPLAMRVRGVVGGFEACRRGMAEELGVGLSEANALAELWFRGALTPSALAERLGLASPSVTALVDRLEVAGLAARSRHPGDRRRVLVELTPTGTAALRTMVDRVAGAIVGAVQDEPPERIRELDRMLQRIAVGLQECATDHAGIAAALAPQPPRAPEHDGHDRSATLALLPWAGTPPAERVPGLL